MGRRAIVVCHDISFNVYYVTLICCETTSRCDPPGFDAVKFSRAARAREFNRRTHMIVEVESSRELSNAESCMHRHWLTHAWQVWTHKLDPSQGGSVCLTLEVAFVVLVLFICTRLTHEHLRQQPVPVQHPVSNTTSREKVVPISMEDARTLLFCQSGTSCHADTPAHCTPCDTGVCCQIKQPSQTQ